MIQRAWQIVVLLCVLLLSTGAESLRAQEEEEVRLGDKIRLKTDDGSRWFRGDLRGLTDSTVVLASGLEQREFSLGNVQNADRWQQRDPIILLATTTAAGALGFWAGGKLRGGDADSGWCVQNPSIPGCPPRGEIQFESGWVTGNRWGDIGVGAGIGVATGLAIWALDPGDWVEWIEP